jgi:hypothetical protein
MCISATAALIASTVVSVAAAGTSAVMQSNAAETESNFRNYQLEIQNRQLADDQELTRLQALETENARRDQSRRLRAANEAYIAGSGVGESRSFLQGVEPQNDAMLRSDVASLRLQSATQISRIADQIAVNKAEGQFARAKASQTATMAYTNAAFNAAGSIAQGAYVYKKFGNK